MKLVPLFLCLAACLVARGAPPEKVAGLKFRYGEWSQISFFSGTEREIFLHANGTYSGLQASEYREGRTGNVLIEQLVAFSIPANGTWSYRVVDDTSAEIVLNGQMLPRLNFEAGKTSGHLGPPGLGRANSFAFAVYDDTPRVVNCATRAYLAPGRSVSLGFVIAGGERRVLVRAIGPGLRAFGATEPLARPSLRVYQVGESFRDRGALVPSAATLNLAAAHAGTFPLTSADDQGRFIRLEPGAYIADVAAIDNASGGEVLIEVYQLP